MGEGCSFVGVESGIFAFCALGVQSPASAGSGFTCRHPQTVEIRGCSPPHLMWA